MALAIVDVETPDGHIAEVDWPSVQFAQFEHDEKYHREISRLSVQDRLRHMALHFAKYAGRLYDQPSDEVVKQTAIDTLIIGISCANILNDDLGRALASDTLKQSNAGEFPRQLTIAAGEMAGACERIDHLEDFPFRRAIREQVNAIVALTLTFFAENEWDPIAEMSARLAGVKAKSIFHGKL